MPAALHKPEVVSASAIMPKPFLLTAVSMAGMPKAISCLAVTAIGLQSIPGTGGR